VLLEDVVVAVVAVAGILTLIIVSVICYAAYKIKAQSFEVSTAIFKLVSFSIKIISPDRHEDEK
jgi:hypothetical protein